jgi:iron complex transport system ATP-binding protein
MMLHLRDLSVKRGPCAVVQDVTLTISAGEFIGLIGPNGAGKTSLMRGALGLMPSGGVSSLAELPAKTRARHAAWLPQDRQVAWPVSVETLVALGRMPHGAVPGPADHRAVTDALARMGLEGFRTRKATELSGGEQARVLIARALAQETPLLMADEPAAGLDPANQIATMEVFAGLAAQGRSVMASLHDLGLAARHCTRLVVLHRGRIAADGPPAQVLTPALLAEVFQISAWFDQTPQGPVFQPLKVLA